MSVGKPYQHQGVRVEPGNQSIPKLIKWADVLVTHFGDQSGADALAREADVPIVKMVHGLVAKKDWQHLDRDEPDLVVWNSRSLLAESGYQGRSVVVHPPFDPDEYRTTPGSNVTLINLSNAKGVSVFAQVSRRLLDQTFLGVHGGYGAQQRVGRVNVRVQVPTTDMRRDVYSRTRVLLMPSAHETWGRVGVEAMVSGIPVLASPTPGLKESLGEAGTFIARSDIEGWVRALKDLRDPDVYAAASEKALKRAADLDPLSGRDVYADAIEELIG